MAWNIVGAAVIGANHERKSLPMQDAYMSMLDRDKLYVSLADGHGSPVCFRSDVGSTLAVVSTIEVVKHHAEQISSMEKPEERERATKNLSQAIVAYWSKKVLEHLRSAPFSSIELSALDDKYKKQLSTNALLAYGSTLMMIVCRKNIVFGFSIGDGDITILTSKGTEFLVNTEKQLGEETYSLCTPNISAHVKYFEAKSEDVKFMMLSTDGYRNSFESEEDFKKVLSDVKDYIEKEGDISLTFKLEDWLKETSKEGSGDDITACFLYNRLS